jgi:hypothetical protein
MTAQVITTRAKIRHYLAALLRDNVDVGRRVFVNRAKSSLFLNELPAVNITFSDEENKVILGDEFFPKSYRRNAAVIVTIVVEDIIAEGEELNESEKGEDFIDFLSMQVEHAIQSDWRFAKRLPGFDADRPSGGLTWGHQITGSSLYEVEIENERKIIAMDIRIVFPYETESIPEMRLPDFKTYKADIIRVGTTPETVDPVLMPIEGAIQ